MVSKKPQLTGFSINGIPSLGQQNIPISTGYLTIVSGANGTGKTTALEILNSCFNNDWIRLKEKQFERIALYFSDLAEIHIEKKDNKIYCDDVEIYFGPKLKDSFFGVYENKQKATDDLIRYMVEQGITKKLSCGHWEFLEDNAYDHLHLNDPTHIRSIDEVLLISYAQNYMVSKVFHESVNRLLNNSIYYISADRTYDRLSQKKNSYSGKQILPTKRVEILKHNFEETIKSVMREKSKTEEVIKNDFLIKILKLAITKSEEDLSETDKSSLDDKIDMYNKKSETLSGLGIKPAAFSDLNNTLINYQKTDSKNGQYTWIAVELIDAYIKGMDKIDNTISRIRVFFDFLENAMPSKKFSVEEVTTGGYELKISSSSWGGAKMENNDIDINTLSSGEMQMFIMGYELLLGETSKDIVLIDEPELSMDGTMQYEFPDFLRKVSEIMETRFIIASHSPLIFAGNEELKVDLSWEGNYKDYPLGLL